MCVNRETKCPKSINQAISQWISDNNNLFITTPVRFKGERPGEGQSRRRTENSRKNTLVKSLDDDRPNRKLIIFHSYGLKEISSRLIWIPREDGFTGRIKARDYWLQSHGGEYIAITKSQPASNRYPLNGWRGAKRRDDVVGWCWW